MQNLQTELSSPIAPFIPICAEYGVAFQELVRHRAPVLVVSWVWYGTSSSLLGEPQIIVDHKHLIVLYEGKLCVVTGLPFKLRYMGPHKMFKGFLFTQVRNRGVFLQNIFKNLVMELEVLDDADKIQ